MFTTGRLIFAGLFFLAFVGIIIISYKKDKKLHARNYKGAQWVLISFIGFVIFLLIIKYLVRN